MCALWHFTFVCQQFLIYKNTIWYCSACWLSHFYIYDERFPWTALQYRSFFPSTGILSINVRQLRDHIMFIKWMPVLIRDSIFISKWLLVLILNIVYKHFIHVCNSRPSLYPPQRSWGGVYWIHPVRPSVRPSVRPWVGVRMITLILFSGFKIFFLHISLGSRSCMGLKISVLPH